MGTTQVPGCIGPYQLPESESCLLSGARCAPLGRQDECDTTEGNPKNDNKMDGAPYTKDGGGSCLLEFGYGYKQAVAGMSKDGKRKLASKGVAASIKTPVWTKACFQHGVALAARTTPDLRDCASAPVCNSTNTSYICRRNYIQEFAEASQILYTYSVETLPKNAVGTVVKVNGAVADGPKHFYDVNNTASANALCKTKTCVYSLEGTVLSFDKESLPASAKVEVTWKQPRPYKCVVTCSNDPKCTPQLLSAKKTCWRNYMQEMGKASVISGVFSVDAFPANATNVLVTVDGKGVTAYKLDRRGVLLLLESKNKTAKEEPDGAVLIFDPSVDLRAGKATVAITWDQPKKDGCVITEYPSMRGAVAFPSGPCPPELPGEGVDWQMVALFIVAVILLRECNRLYLYNCARMALYLTKLYVNVCLFSSVPVLSGRLVAKRAS